MPTKDDFKRNCCISDSFINTIDKITQFPQKVPSGHCKEINLTSGNTTTPLLANVDCRFFGRYYKITNDFYFWIGYDFRKNENQRFYISFYGRSEQQADKIKKNVRKFTRNL